jgi:thiol-disulfide isomerase/thioredoxin
MQIGIVGSAAPELQASYWIDSNGRERQPLKLAELGSNFKVLFFFQHWCPGCHTDGFPQLKRLVDHLEHRGMGLVAIQTVFEGMDTNTKDKILLDQQRHHLKIPFGHDAPLIANSYPATIENYRSGGTPWFVVINPSNVVIYNDFRLDFEKILMMLKPSPSLDKNF